MIFMRDTRFLGVVGKNTYQNLSASKFFKLFKYFSEKLLPLTGKRDMRG